LLLNGTELVPTNFEAGMSSFRRNKNFQTKLRPRPEKFERKSVPGFNQPDGAATRISAGFYFALNARVIAGESRNQRRFSLR
jgi:hypothetical protein